MWRVNEALRIYMGYIHIKILLVILCVCCNLRLRGKWKECPPLYLPIQYEHIASENSSVLCHILCHNLRPHLTVGIATNCCQHHLEEQMYVHVDKYGKKKLNTFEY